MKLRCPGCGAGYVVDDSLLEGAGDLAACHRCGTFFRIRSRRRAQLSRLSTEALADALALTAELSADRPPGAANLPFDVPDDLDPLEPDADAGLSIEDALHGGRRSRSGWAVPAALLLVAGLAAQLAWQYREPLLQRFPQLEALCEHLPCRPQQVPAPDAFRVLHRDIGPADHQPDALTLDVRFRNEARAAQPLPDIQLSLLDNLGSVLIRRRLAPAEYLFPPPDAGARLEPGEVVTLSLDFEDPGYHVTGFIIDFL